MLTCRGCGATVPDWYGVPWCDRCGGVAKRPGVLLLRHVATADGAGGRFPIVFDRSTSDYAAHYPKPPGTKPTKMRGEPEGFRAPPIYTVHGTLDACIAVIQPYAKGDGAELPSLFAAPTATEEEKALLSL